MKILLASITLFGLLLLTLLSGAGWLLYSEPGAAWLLGRITASTGLRVETVEGSLIGRLRLSALRFEDPETVLACEIIEIDSQLSGIVPLQLAIERLRVAELSLTDHSSATPSPAPTLVWPKFPWWLGWIDIELQQLKLEEISFQQDADPVTIELLSGSGRWSEAQLQATIQQLQAPDHELSGNLTASLDLPAVELQLQIDNRRPQQPWQRLKLQGALSASDQRLLTGPVSFNLADKDGAWLSATGELSLENDAILLQGVQLTSARRSGRLVISGNLNLSSLEAGLEARLQLQELDLQPEIGKPLRLSGEIKLNGNLDNYRGRFSLASRSAQPLAAKLSGNFNGDRQQLQLNELSGSWLAGQLNGHLQADWRQGLQLSGLLDGRQLDPQLVNESLQGKLNFSLQGEFGDRGQGPIGKLSLQLHDTVLQQLPLAGQLELLVKQGQLDIESLSFQGQGFQLHGKGALADKIELTWQVEQLEHLLAGVHGKLRGKGIVKLSENGINADFTSQGNSLQHERLVLDRWQLKGKLESSEQLNLTVYGSNFTESRSGLTLRQAQVKVDGTVKQHTVNFRLDQPVSSLDGALSGGWADQQWQGKIDQLLIEDSHLGRWSTVKPVPLLLSEELVEMGRLQLAAENGASLWLQGSYLPPTQTGDGQLVWQSLDMGLLNPWLTGAELTGNSSGNIKLQQQQPAHLLGKISWQGEIKTPHQSFVLTQGDWQADWGEHGLQSQLNLKLTDGSRLEILLGNEEKFATRWPHSLQLQLRGEGISLQHLRPWLPPELNLTGKLKLQAEGNWKTAQVGQFSGLTELSGAQLSWQEDDETINTEITNAQLHWQWHKQLSGQLVLQLEEHGDIDADISLPLPATWPLRIDPQHPLQGTLATRVQELGFLSVLFPGQVQESSGQIKLELQLDGNWQQPKLNGEVRLFDAKAFLPRAGIQLYDIELQGHFDEQRFSLNRFQVSAGEGSLSGTGELKLESWQPQQYRLNLNGKNFRLLNLPNLQALVSPELKLNGDFTQIEIEGTLLIPQLLASGQQKAGLAEKSPDLIIVDAPPETSKPLRIQPHLNLQLQLGEKVLLKTAGIDARLEGSLRMESTPQQALAAFGKISVAQGRYASYGVNLDISRGNLIFNGGPINQPLLDILALRTAGEVKAGVQITGIPKQPLVKLYSEPTMPETEILSYIVLGRPISAQGGQTNILMSAAGALLSQGESVVLQDKLKSKLGLDVLEIDAGNGDVTNSMITTGKYLSPDLYVSFGYSLFNDSNEIKFRYTLSPRWEVESNFGNESGADIFYKIDIP